MQIWNVLLTDTGHHNVQYDAHYLLFLNIICNILHIKHKATSMQNYNKDDLIIEAETLESTGEYLHIELAGYSPDELRTMANNIEIEESR